MVTTSASGHSPTWPLFLSRTNVDTDIGAGLLRRLEGCRCRSSVSCSNSHPAPALGIGIGREKRAATAKENEESCVGGGKTEHEEGAEYEDEDCECDCKRPGDCDDSGFECECYTRNPVGRRDIKPTCKTACGCARYRDPIRAERRKQRQHPALSPTTGASIAAQHQHRHQQVQNPSLPPPQPQPQPPPQHPHQPTMLPRPIFVSCGHSPPPLPALPSASASATPTALSIPGYCRPCDFTNTRRTIVRICEHYEEQIADLETRIEKAKVELFRSWNDYLGERKDMAVRAVARLKEMKEEGCQGKWREFDERWGGKPVAGAA